MANTKLSGLTAASATADADLFYTAQGGTSKKATALQLKTYFSASPTLVAPTLGVAAGTSLALGGATIGANALAVTGTANISGTITTSGSVTAASGVVTGQNLVAGASGNISFTGRTQILSPADGQVLWRDNSAVTIFDFGVTTASTLTVPNVTLTGALKLGNAYVATPQVTSGYVTIKDSTGTTYKVCVAT